VISITLLDAYEAELVQSGLLAVIGQAKQHFDQTVSGTTCRGNPYGFGGMRSDMVPKLYGLVRELHPDAVVETGVCNGESTALILAAIERNGSGVLHSIDWPEIAETEYAEGAFWAGKKGAVIPKNRQPGWVVPERLRKNWRLTLGRTQDVLRPLLSHLEVIDLFLHDSEHSEECMWFEYEAAWEHLRPGGVLVSDDITWNDAFDRFADRVGRTPLPLGRNTALIVK
jgi:predicted O-methyltransferase YrrM